MKLLAVELHSADTIDRNHREACQSILNELFGQIHAECGIDHDGSNYILHNDTQIGANGPIGKSKVTWFIIFVEIQFLPDLFYSGLASLIEYCSEVVIKIVSLLYLNSAYAYGELSFIFDLRYKFLISLIGMPCLVCLVKLDLLKDLV